MSTIKITYFFLIVQTKLQLMSVALELDLNRNEWNSITSNK